MRFLVALNKLFNKTDKKIEPKIQYKLEKNAKRFLIFITSLFLLAIVFNLFLEPLNIASGGSNGIAIIIKEVFGIDASQTTYVIYLITLILSLFCLSKEITISLVIATLVYPFFVDITSNITDVIILDYSNPLLISIFAGVLKGIGTGIILKIGLNSGGLIVIANVIYKYFKISISKTNMMMNSIIVLISGYYFGISNILYAIIVIYISTIVTDRVMLGVSSNKFFFIVTKKEKEVKDFITKYINVGVTVIDNSDSKKTVLIGVVPTNKYFVFKEGITTIDDSAFWYTSDSYQVLGEFKGGKYGHN